MQQEVSIKPTKDSLDQLNDLGPQKIQRLLSRLDMANHVAKCGYSLNIIELSELLDMPTTHLEKKEDSWQWRDWLIEPIGNDRWRLRLSTKESTTSKRRQND